VATTTITLPDDQLEQLRHVALSSGRSLDEVVREAVGAYLTRLPEAAEFGGAQQRPRSHDAEGQVRVGVGADGMRVHIPPAMSPDEAEALLAEPSPEARRENLRAWLEKRGARVIYEPPPGPPDPAWQTEVERLLARIRARVPPDMTPDEIEALITEVSEEARQERIARRERTGD
jgi:Arc/MetJ-type ribon-helix-helix transcriptional regulator